MTQTRTVQTWLISVCKDLGLSVTSGDDDFFEAGGNSLTAIKLIARVDAEFGEEALDPEDLFARSRIDEIAAAITTT